MSEVDRDHLELRDDESLLSPPILVGPLYACSSAVQVRGFIPQAWLDIEVDGTVVAPDQPAGFPEPNGAIIHLSAGLNVDQIVRARQRVGGVTSAFSAPQQVRDHTADYPAGLPPPRIDPTPVYRCGSRTGVSNLVLGCDVWITSDAAIVGRVKGAISHQSVNVAPDYELGRQVRAWAELCHDPSPSSPVEGVQPPPVPLGIPTFEDVHEGSSQITLNGTVNGGWFTLQRNGVDEGTYHTRGGRFFADLGAPVRGGDVFTATQILCPGDPPSHPGSGTALPCAGLRAPTVAPIQAGDTSITLLKFVSDARIKVFVNLIKVGDGGGPTVALSRAIQHGDIIHVLQIVGACVSAFVDESKALCVAPPTGVDPSALTLYPVGFKPYEDGTAQIRTNSHVIAGTVYYPSETYGEGTPFHSRLGRLGPVPIVFLVHGRHGPATPSHLGYDYLQQQLAAMGIIAVSVNCNATDGWGGWADNIRDRAELVMRSIEYFKALHDGGDPLFGGRVDFGRTGLFGHSRGGDAVVVIPEVINIPGVTVTSVLSLAPVNSRASSGRPHGYPAFMTILPAYDGDVVENNGAEFYDQAVTSRFRSQLYIENTNHNFFNREWTNDDAQGVLPLLSRSAHEQLLSAYGCAFFRAMLLGHDTLGFLEGRVLPAGVDAAKVQVSFGWNRSGSITVDSHEDGNGIGVNSLGRPTTSSAGLTADEYDFGQNLPRPYNRSFFGETVGMVAVSGEVNGTFRTELAAEMRVAGREIWVRAAEVYDGATLAPTRTGFELGLEFATGAIVWIDSDDVGGLSMIQDRRAFDVPIGFDMTKTMPKTLRFPAGCFAGDAIVAVRLRLNRPGRRPIAFDDLQII